MWRIGAAFFVTMVGTTMPTPLYPLYQRELGFDGLMVTIVFATYAIGVLTALVLFGRLSDRIGRKAVLLPGMAVAAASSLVFLIPDSLPALFVGRFLSGISAGVFTGVATATIVDLAPPGGKARAALLAASVNILGLGSGPVLAGALAAYAPAPLELTYLVHAGLLALAAVGVAGVGEPVERRPFVWELQRPAVPAAVRPVFVRAAIAGFAGLTVIGFFTAASPLFIGQVLGLTNPLVTGVTVFVLLGSSAIGQVASARAAERTSLLAGCLAMAAGIGVVAAGIATAALPVLLAGAVVAGLGQGASFRAGLAAVTGAVDADRRSEVSSAYFFVLYVALSIPVVSVGAAAQLVGLVPASVGLAITVAVLALTAFALLARDRALGNPPRTARSR